MGEYLIDFLKEVLRVKKKNASQLAKDLKVSHATISRWLSGKDRPSIYSCVNLAAYTGLSVGLIMAKAGYDIVVPAPLGDVNLPGIREYTDRKYPDVFDEDLITYLEKRIERARVRQKK